jgi:hypothetical protein
VIGLGFWAYRENYATQAALRGLSDLQDEIADLRDALSVQRAEWAYLNRPDRLRELATVNFDRLGLLRTASPAPHTPETIIQNEKRAGHPGRPVSKFLRCRRPQGRLRGRLEGLELRRGHLAGALVLLELEANALALVEAGESSALDRRDVHEDVRAALLRLDEAVALLLVEPFNSTGRHVDLVFR